MYRHLQRQDTFTITVEFPQQLTSEHEHKQLMPPGRLIEHFLSSHLHPEAGILRPAVSDPPPAICLAVVPIKLNMLYFLPFTSP